MYSSETNKSVDRTRIVAIDDDKTDATGGNKERAGYLDLNQHVKVDV